MAARSPWVLVLLLGVAGCRGGCDGAPGRGATATPDASLPGARLLPVAAQPEESPARDGGTLRLHVEAEPPTLNPLVEHDAWTMWIGLGAIYDPLVRQDPASGAISPSLATAWRSDGEAAIVFTLRAGVRWHDGRELTAQDVVWTFARLSEPGVAPDARADLAGLRSVQLVPATAMGAAASSEIRFDFDGPAPTALQAIARVPILPAHRFAPGDLRPQEASRAPVGTGPFRFVEWRPGVRILLERAPGYWGSRPHLDAIEMRIVRDREVAFELAERGELDLVWQLSPSQVDRALVDGKLASLRLVSFALPRYAFIVWNQRVAPLGDRRVRQALTMLVDRDRYRRVVYRGRARAVTCPFLEGTSACDPTMTPWPFDPARARTLLDQAGLVDRDGDGVRELPGGAPFRIAFLLTAGSPTLEPLATMMQQDFARAGVALSIVPTEWASLLERLRQHAFDASSLMWTDLKPAQDNAPYFHSAEAERGQNYGGWKSPEADRLLDELRRTPPGPERSAREQAFHRLVQQEQPYTFLASPEVVSLVAGRVHGYRPDTNGPGFDRLWIAEPGQVRQPEPRDPRDPRAP